jgi:microcystin-dependent protein
MTQYAKPPILPTWAQAGDKIQPTDAELLVGWPATSTPPSRQRFNFALNYSWQGIRYFMQRSIADWAAAEDYPAGAHVRAPNGKTYRAIADTTNQEPSANAGVWERWGFTLTELYTEQNQLAPRADPIFTGNPRGITRPVGDNTTSLASTAFVTRAVNDALSGLIPVGLIAMWNGAIDTIPAKWQLCDGTNGTPDFRDKFLVGAGGTYAVDASGGAAQVALSVANMPSHQHTGETAAAGTHTHTASTDAQGYHNHGGSTTSAGAHNHQSGISRSVAVYGGGGPADDIGENMSANPIYTSTNGDHGHGIYADGTHAHNVTINAGGAHAHTYATSLVGGSTAHENRPPYLAKAFIMRVTV